MMVTVSLRTLLFYNFGLALVFVLIGSLSVYSLNLTQPNRKNEPAVFSEKARAALEQEQDLEVLRSRSLFYFDTSKYMRAAKQDDTDRVLNDIRVLSFAVAAFFVLGGILATLLARSKSPRAGGR